MSENEKGLGNQVIRGSFWIMALEISNQGLQFLKTFYSARLLTPADFGVIGLAFLVIVFIDTISTTGMKEAIIQRKEDLASYLDTVWLTETAKGIVVLALAWFGAPFIAGFVKGAEVELTTKVIRFIGVIYFIQCSTNIGVLYFEKQMEFHKFFLYQFSGTLVDVVVSVVLVSIWQNVWGLFYGIVAGAATRMIFSYILVRYRPGIDFSFKKARELLHYGKWILKGRIFSFFGLQADSIVVSSFYSIASLGVYQMAFRIGNLPMSQVSNIIVKLAFPAFSRLQDDRKKLRDYFLSSFNILSVCFLPVVILVFVFIPEFTMLFLKEKWVDIIPVVRVLVLSGFLRIYVSLTDSYFSAVGHPKISSDIQLFRFIIFAVAVIPLGYWWGITGVALSSLTGLLAVLIWSGIKSARDLGIPLGDAVHFAVLPILYSAVIGGAAFALKHWMNGYEIAGFIGLVCATLAIYFISGWLLNKFTRVKIFSKTLLLLDSLKLRL